MMNATRVQAWKGILYASLAVLGAFFALLVSESVIWTGGLLLAALWVVRAISSLLRVNRHAHEVQARYGVNLLAPLPTWLKISNILLIPFAGTLALVGVVAFLDPPTVGYTPTAEIIRMVEPTEADALAAGYEYYSAVEVEIIGGTCAELVIDSSVVLESTDELITTFQNYEYDVPEGLHSFVIGTDDSSSDYGDTFVVDDAYCL